MAEGPTDGDGWGSQPPPPSGPPSAPPPPPPSGPSGGRAAGIVPRHPMSLNDIIDATVTLYRRTLPAVAVTVVVVLGPLNLLSAIPGDTAFLLDPSAPTPSVGAMVLLGLAVLVTSLVSPLVTATVMWIAVQRDRGVDLDWQEAYRAVGPRFPRLLGATLLLVLLGLVALVLVGVPAVLVGLSSRVLGALVALLLGLPLALALTAVFTVVIPVVLLEGARPWLAVRRAVELIRPRLWPVAGTVLLTGLLVGFVGGMASYLFDVVGGVIGTGGFVLTAVGTTVNTVLAVPLTANVALLIYVDARIRRDGLPLPAIASSSAPPG